MSMVEWFIIKVLLDDNLFSNENQRLLFVRREVIGTFKKV